MRGMIFFLDLLLFLFFFGSLFNYLVFREYPISRSLGRIACDIAFVVESKKEISEDDIDFMLEFIPEEAYFEINSTRIYFLRNSTYSNLFSCVIENTTVKIGI